MIRKIILGLGMLAMSSIANASLIISETLITGADMAGMEVTVTFGDDSTESMIWQVIADNNGVSIQDAEGRVGGATATTWSLQQQGYTLGGVDNGIFYGLWTFVNNNALGVKSLSINGLMAGAASIVFDSLDDAPYFPGSGGGQAFVTMFPGATGVYGNQVDANFPDLFYSLTINFANTVQVGETVTFFADTDALAVSEPGVLALMLMGLGLAARRKVRVLK